MQSQHQLKDWLATDFAHKWVETELRAIDATPEQSNPRCLQVRLFRIPTKLEAHPYTT